MNAQSALVPFIQRNLEATARFAKLPALTFSSTPEVIVNRLGSWLPQVVIEHFAMPQDGEYLDMQHYAVVGSEPPQRVIRHALAKSRTENRPSVVRDRWIETLHALRANVEARTSSLSAERAISIWVAAAALTAIALPADTQPGMVIVPYITQPDGADVTDRQRVALRLSLDTIRLLPLYHESSAAAVAEGESRIELHLQSLRANTLDRHRDRVELKQLIYFFARHDPKKSGMAGGTSRGVHRMKKMQNLLVDKRLAQDHAEAAEILRSAHILPELSSDEANDVQTYEGSIRFKALEFIALRRNGLMRPELFRAFGTPRKQSYIVARLVKEGLDDDDISALCGLEHVGAKEKT